jgi:cell division protein FtsB
LIDKAIEYEGQIAALKAENEDQKALIAKLTAEIEPLKPVAAE